MATLHLGSADPEAVIALLPNDVRVFNLGDSWEVWGEGYSDEHPVKHIVVRGKSTHEYLADIAWLIENGAPLEPMRFEYFNVKTLAAITSEEDWSETYYVLHEGNQIGELWYADGRCVYADDEDHVQRVYGANMGTQASVVRPWRATDGSVV